jgi:IclR family acetate operon transcriptional repressor
MPAATKQRYRIPMLERSLRTLELLSNEPQGLSIAELSRRLTAPKSSVFNIVATLEQTGYVRLLDGTNKYSVTMKLYRLGSATLAHFNLKQTLHPLLVELTQTSGETANLGVLDGDEALYLESMAGTSRVRVAVSAGEPLDLHCTALGKVLLAYLPLPEQTRLLKGQRLRAHTPNTITTLKTLKAQLAQIHQCGFAFDDEEDHLDIRCIGAPIRDHTGNVIAAVSITAPKHRLPDDAVERRAAQVMAIAARMSQALGYEQ